MSRVEHLERHVDDLRLILAMKQDEIERLRELFVLVSGYNEAPHPCKSEIDHIVAAALERKTLPRSVQRLDDYGNNLDGN